MGWLPKVGSLCAAEKQQQPKLKQREEEGEGKGSTTPQMASRVAGQNRVAEEGASDGERSKALEGEVDLKFCCAPAPHGRTTKPFSPSLYVTTLETIAFRSNVSLEQLFHSLLNAF